MNQSEKPYVIVVGVDLSEESNLALDQAITIGSRTARSELHVVHVVSTVLPVPSVDYPAAAPVSLASAGERLRSHVDARLAEHEADFSSPYSRRPERVVCHIRLDAPSEEIAQLAADLEADLVVVGTHGRRGIGRLILGSVAEGVVRAAPCPVFVVRPKRVIEMPRIEPPCPECVKTRQATAGAELWCEQHRERHGQRHTYFGGDRVSHDGSMPLVMHGGRN
jgi:nucleotide-binding universal stress UspA family protein